MMLDQRPNRRPQRSVGIEAPEGALREVSSHALVAKEMDVAVESDAASQRFSGVMQESRPAHSGTGRSLANDADCVIPEIFLTAEPWRDVRLGLGRKRLDLGERDLQQARPAQCVEPVIDVLSHEQQGELSQNPFSADAGETWRLARHRLFRPPIEPEAELRDEASRAQEPQRILDESHIGVSDRAH
jgi:hypothetical protein